MCLSMIVEHRVGGSVKHTHYVNKNNGSCLQLEKKGVYGTHKRSEKIKTHLVYNPIKTTNLTRISWTVSQQH